MCFSVNPAGKLKLNAFIRIFFVGSIFIVCIFSLEVFNIPEVFCGAEKQRFLSSSFVLARPSLFAPSWGTKIGFRENKYWKLGEFIDISEFVLIYLRIDFFFRGGKSFCNPDFRVLLNENFFRSIWA